jgi:hypothetical protein
VARINPADAGVGAHLRLELLGHGAGQGHAQAVGFFVLPKAGGQHRLGVGTPIIGRDQQQRCFAVQLAKLGPGYSQPAQCQRSQQVRSFNLQSQSIQKQGGSADFDHLEIHFANAAVRAQPVFRDVLPSVPGAIPSSGQPSASL